MKLFTTLFPNAKIVQVSFKQTDIIEKKITFNRKQMLTFSII